MIESKIVAVESCANPIEWDNFAQCCNTSFRCMHRATQVWKLEHGLFARLLRLNILLDMGSYQVKIGQCAVSLKGTTGQFSDALQLLPAYQNFWAQAMEGVLLHTGPGHYQYGSDWNMEICRAEELGKNASVHVKKVHSVDLLAVDFTRWNNWDDYYNDVSTNAKRNVKKSEKIYSNIAIQGRTGKAVYFDIIPMQQARANMFRRKNVQSNWLALSVRSSLRTFATEPYSHSTTMKADGDVVARYLGIDFGRISFFLEAASSHATHGASSYLLKSMIERTFHRTHGKGIFVFGPDDHRQKGHLSWEGLVRSRFQWNARPYATSIITFEFR